MLNNNNIYNPQQNPQFAALAPQQSAMLQQQPSMQAVNPEMIRGNVQDSYVANKLPNAVEDPNGTKWTALLALPTWYGIAKGMDIYNAKSAGDYEKSIQGRIGSWADNLTNKFKSSSFGKSGFVTSINNGLKSAKTFLREKVINKSKVLTAFFDTPSKPELGMVKGQAEGMIGMIAFDYQQVAENFIKPKKYPTDLASYGATADEIKRITEEVGKATSEEARALIMQKAEFECLAKNSRGTKLSGSALSDAIKQFANLDVKERIAKLNDMKAFELGYNDFKEFSIIKESTSDYLPRIMEASHNANRNMYSIAYESKPSLLGRAKKTMLDRKVYMSEIANKMASSLGDKAQAPEWQKVLKSTGLDVKIPKSSFAKMLTKYNNIILEGATNRVAGGKLIAIMQAWYLAEAIYKSAKAKGGAGEKAKTFAERLTDLVAMFACIPPAIMMMHKIGGLQYIGMSKEQVAKYRKNLSKFNADSLAAKLTEAQHKAGAKALKEELNAGVKNPFLKLLKRIGKTVSIGLEQVRPYQATASTRKTVMEKLKDMWKSPKHFKFGLKQMLGYPMRIILGMMIIMPFFTKLAVKACHKIFGKPKESLLDEGKEKPQEQQANAVAAQNPQIPQQLQQQTQQPLPAQNAQQVPVQGGNLLDKYRNGQPQPVAQNGLPNGRTYIPSSAPAQFAEPLRTYVPSPVGVQLTQGEDLTAYNTAMSKADKAEQSALETLKMI